MQAAVAENQSETLYHSTRHLIGSSQRLLQTVARQVAYSVLWPLHSLHTEKPFRNLIKSNRNRL